MSHNRFAGVLGLGIRSALKKRLRTPHFEGAGPHYAGSPCFSTSALRFLAKPPALVS